MRWLLLGLRMLAGTEKGVARVQRCPVLGAVPAEDNVEAFQRACFKAIY